MLKDILFVCDSRRDAARVMAHALALAANHDARVCGLGLIYDPMRAAAAASALAGPMAVAPNIPVLQHEMETMRNNTGKIAAELTKRSARSGAETAWKVVEGPTSEVTDTCVTAARISDLVLLGVQQDVETWASDWSATVRELVRSSGRPCLLVPYGLHRAPTLRHVTIAWDGSSGCARAIHDALPIIAAADQILIVAVNESDRVSEAERLRASSGDLAAHLNRHGLAATPQLLQQNARSVSDTLLGALAHAKSDLLVMGAFGNSQLQELLFGSTTRSIIENCDVPLLVSH